MPEYDSEFLSSFQNPRSCESVNDPRSDRRERVAPRTRFFLSNSLVPQTSPRCSSTFRFFSLRPSSSFSIVSLFPPPSPSQLQLLQSSSSSPLCRCRSVVASFLFPAKPPRSRSEKPERIFIGDLVHNERDPHPSHRDRRSPIPDRKVGAEPRFLSRPGSLLSHCVEKCRLDFQPVNYKNCKDHEIHVNDDF